VQLLRSDQLSESQLFRTVEVTALERIRRGHLQCYYLPIKFHNNLLIGKKTVGGKASRLTDRKHDDLISLTFLFTESSLKTQDVTFPVISAFPFKAESRLNNI
jgi:hypothetical protein